MKTKILAFLLFISCSAFAQEFRNDDFFPQFTFGIGGSFQKFDGINQRVTQFPGYKKLDDYAATLELGMLKERHRFISDMNLMIGSSLSNHNKKGSVIRFLGINLGIGYDLLPNKNISLYPLAGIGVEGFQAKFYRDNSSIPFDNLLLVPATQSAVHSVDFTNCFFNYRLGFGVNLISDKRPFGSIGLQAVYTGSFNKQAWKSSQNQSLGNAPEDRLSQYHLALIFGMQSGFSMKH
ncbi:MAG: hypothetical protein JST75_20860 [Bacteroidetes bacterium]|nr:hypothetical protein [Bacteroidota bacterium]